MRSGKLEKILILGATGNVGSKVFKRIEDEKYNVVGTTSKIDKTGEKIQLLNVEDDKRLFEYIRNCDIVINCIGPSYKYKNKIIDISNRLDKGYIDIFGGQILEKSLKNARRNVSIINAGYEPGVMSIILKKFSNFFSDPDISINLFSGGNEFGGYAAFSDIILSTINGYNKSDYYIKNGVVTRANSEGISNTKRGKVIEPNYRLYLTKEMEKFAEKYNVPNLYSYKQVYDVIDNLILETCIMLFKLKEIDNPDNIILESYEKTYNISFINEFHIKAELLKQGELIDKIELKIKNTSSLISILVMIILEKMLRGEIPNGGYWAFEIVNYDELINKLNIINDNTRIYL